MVVMLASKLPRSRQGQRPGRPARGITLMELMIVLAISAVMMGLAVISANPESRAEREAEEMQTALIEAAIIAREQHQPVGFFVASQNNTIEYQFALLKSDTDFAFGHPDASPLRWVPLSGRAIDKRALRSEVELFADSFTLAQAQWTEQLQANLAKQADSAPGTSPAATADAGEAEDFPLPPVLINSDGTFTPFSVRIRDGNAAWVVEGNDQGLRPLRVAQWGEQ